MTREGQAIHLSPKAFELLTVLALARPNALSKSDLQQRLWPDTFVAEANLSNLIAEIRAALGDSPRSPVYLRTVHKFGYAFCGHADTDGGGATPSAVLCWLEWGVKRFPLTAGEHVIGRDAEASVRIESGTVSRRHARLVAARERVVLEDTASKNGTFRGDERLTAPVTLADGDHLRFGSVPVVFHLRPDDATETMEGLSEADK